MADNEKNIRSEEEKELIINARKPAMGCKPFGYSKG